MRSFWLEAGKWPRDPVGSVFLARAVHALGKAMYGEEWSGAEPCVTVPPPLPLLRPSPLQSPSQMLRAGMLLRQHRPDLDNSLARPHDTLPYQTREWTDEAWTEARKLCALDRQKLDAAVKRFRSVQLALAEAGEAGTLLTRFRATAGGSMADCPRDWWATDRLDPRFSYCQIDPRAPFGTSIAGERMCHLFVEADSFAKLLSVQRFAARPMFVKPAGIPDDVHLSPYLRLMISVAREVGIGPAPEQQTKIDALVASLTAEAERMGIPASTRLLGAMATALREPEAQVGTRKLLADQRKGAPKTAN